MSPAEVAIEVFGGIRAAARVLDIEPSTVWRWRWEARCSGRIPDEHKRALLDTAAALGKRLTLEELTWGRPAIARRIVRFEPATGIGHMAQVLTKGELR